MNRPTMALRSRPILRGQTYYFPVNSQDDATAMAKVVEILCEDIEFHELLAKHGFTVTINTDWSISFQGPKDCSPAAKYSRMQKLMWDHGAHILRDYGFHLKNKRTGKVYE